MQHFSVYHLADAQSMQINVRSSVLSVLYVLLTKRYKSKHKHVLTNAFVWIVLLTHRVDSHVYL